MSTALRFTPRREQENYLNDGYSVRSWLLTTDHKRIAHPVPALDHRLLLPRRHRRHGSSASTCSRPTGALVNADTYNKLFTLHGVIMVFFFLIPSIPAVLGNFLVPHDDRRHATWPSRG